MNIFNPAKRHLYSSFVAAVVAVLFSATALVVCADEPKASQPAATNSVKPTATAPEAAKPAGRKKLTGAELYSIHCNRCHPERYPTERTAAQWKTIMLHMQVRAGIPGKQSRLILQYLQENSGR